MPNYSAGTASIDLKPSFKDFVRDAKAELKAMDLVAEIRLDPKLTEAEAELKRFRASAERAMDVAVGANVDPAKAELAAFRAREEANAVRLHADVDKSSGARVRSSVGAITRDLRDVGTIVIKVGAVEGAAGAVASLLSVADAAAKVSHLAGLAPAVGFAGLAGIGSAAVGLNGIPAAFKAISAASKDSVGSAAKQQDALDGVAEAQYRIGEAQASVGTAARELADDQGNLNDVYKDASRSLRDVNLSLKEQKLSVGDAAIAVREAAIKLQESRHNPRLDADERQKEENAYQRTILRLQGEQNKTRDLQADTAEANAKGVEGAKPVVAAKQKIADAATAEAKAQHEVTQAYVGLRKAQDATKSAGGQDKVASALAQLSPNAKQLVADVRSLGPAWTNARTAASDALTDGMGSAVKNLANAQLPNLKLGLVGIDRELNVGLRATLDQLGTKNSQLDFHEALHNTDVGFQGIARAAAPLTQALTTLTTAGTALFPEWGREIGDASIKFDQFIGRTAADGSLRKWIDDGVTSAKELVQTVDHVGSSIGSVFRAASAGGEGLKGLDDVTGRLSQFLKSVEGQDKLGQFFAEGREEADRWKPILADVGGLLHAAAAGAADWSAILMPFLRTAADLLHGHEFLVEAAVAAYLGFKTVKPALGVAEAAFGSFRQAAQKAGTEEASSGFLKKFNDNLATTVGGTVSGLRTITTAQQGVAQVSGIGSVALGGFGSSIQKLGQSASAVGKMQQTFLDTATAAGTLGRTQGAIAAGASGIRSTASGVVGFFGGPWTVGIGAATGVLGVLIDNFEKGRQAAKDFDTDTRELTVSQSNLATIFQKGNGAFNGEAIGNIAGQVKTLSKSFGDAQANDPTGFYGRAKKSIDDLKISDEQLAQAMSSDSGFAELQKKLQDSGEEGRFAAAHLAEMRREIENSRLGALNSTPGFATLTTAVKTLSDTSASATDRMGAMTQALDVLAGKPVQAQDAMEAYNKQLRDTDDVIKDLADHSQGFGAQLRNADGSVNTATANGTKLYDTLKALRDRTAEAALAGQDIGPILKDNAAKFQKLGDSAGQSKDQIEGMAKALGYRPESITILAQLKGADSVQQQLVTVRQLLQQNAGTIEVPIDFLPPATQQSLKDAGADIQTLKDKGVISITATNQQALDSIDAIAKLLATVNDKTVTVDVRASREARQLFDNWWRSPTRALITPEPRAAGGPITGGTPGKDSVPLLGMPGEHMLTTGDVDRLGGQEGVYRFRAALAAGEVGKYAAGGAVGADQTKANAAAGRVQALNAFAASRNGAPYVLGGPEDCSGFQSELANIAVGLAPNSGRMATSNEGPWLQALNFQLGTGGPGSFRIGWIDDPSMPGGGHTAGTLPSGTNVESNGDAGVQYGGAALGANAAMFVEHAYLQMGSGVAAAPGAITTPDSSSVSTQSVTYPQAPAVGRRSESQITGLTDKAAVDDANSQRNKVYADTSSSPQDKLNADLKLESAQNTLEESQKKGKKGDKDSELLSLPGFLGSLGEIVGTGILSSLGLENSILSPTNPWNKAIGTGVDALAANAGPPGTLGGYGYVPQNLPSIVTTVTEQPGANGTAPSEAAVPVQPGDNGTVEGKVKAVMADRKWNVGPEWDALDQLVGHESSWSPIAQNPESTAYGLFQFLDETWGTVGAVKTSDPTAQARAGEKYIQNRYGDPEAAWSFWQAQSPHWYDDGGEASGVGLMMKNVIRPERVLNPSNTETFNSVLPLLESINATTGGGAPSAINSAPFAAPGADGGGKSYDHSISIGNVQTFDVESLRPVIERIMSEQAMAHLGAY